MTRQRRMILDVIRESDRHMTAEEIYIETKKRMPSVAMATIYNNLKILTEQGVIRRLQFAGMPDHYDRNMVYHEHLICESCRNVTDAEMGDLLPVLEQRLGIHITHYNLSMFYICDACRRAQAEKD